MTAGRDVMHSSSLALEAVLAGQGSAETGAHLSQCATCRARFEVMEHAGARFSRSPKSFHAKAAFRAADRRWKQRVVMTAVVPLAAAVVLAIGLRSRAVDENAAPEVATRAAPTPRHGRELLEPRGGIARGPLRQVSVRGHAYELGEAALEAVSDDGLARPFTLQHTRVDITVRGFWQSVQVTQVYTNPFVRPVEAIYLMPLPDDAAVHELRMKAGAREILGVIRRREEARSLYEAAKATGRRAALLDQERPNLFTQSLSNLLPGETVEVSLRYDAPLAFDDGVYAVNFPMVVGSRYVPGTPLPGVSQGVGSAPDTDVVPDGSRISPPETRAGRDVEVHLRLESSTPIEDFWSVSHRLQLEREGRDVIDVKLDEADRLPNRDFIVRWKAAGPEVRGSMLAGGGAYALMINPELISANLPTSPKELVFVIDTSGSMEGAPLEAAKRAMTLALHQLRPEDTFMLIDFAERARVFNPTPLPAREAPRAIQYLQSLPSGGGTNQLAGIRKALNRPTDPERLRMVLLLTDGFIGNEDEIFQEVERIRGDARVFTLGVGGSVNHFLLNRLAQEGRGFSEYVRTDEDPTEVVTRFTRRIRTPLITDVSLEWSGVAPLELRPEPIADLFDAQPLVVLGRYIVPGDGKVTLRGRRAGQPVKLEVPVHFPPLDSEGTMLRRAWARHQIELLSARRDTTADAEIQLLGLEHHLVTPFTSLVAVDTHPVTFDVGTVSVEPTFVPEETKPLVNRRFNTIQIIRGTGAGGGGLLGSSGIGGGGEILRGKGGGSAGYKPATLGTLIQDSPEKQAHQGTPRTIEGLLAPLNSRFAVCRERMALVLPTLHGTLIISYVIEPSGALGSLQVLTTSLENTELARCVLQQLRTFRTPQRLVVSGPQQLQLEF